MRKNNTLYLSDLDGVLLTKEGNLSNYSKVTLIQLLNAGLMFTVSSARSVNNIQTILCDISLPLPVIALNGAFISDLHNAQHKIIQPLEKNLAHSIYQYLIKTKYSPFITTYGTQDNVYYTTIENAGMRWYIKDCQQKKDPRLKQVKHFSVVFQEQIISITIIATKTEISHLASRLESQFTKKVLIKTRENIYSPGWYWLTINNLMATPEQATKRLLHVYNLLNYDLVIFGHPRNEEKFSHFANRYIKTISQPDAVVRFITSEWKI